MSEHPTEYGKELIEAVARATCQTSGLCKYISRCNTSRCTIPPVAARAALLAAFAKLREPPFHLLEIGEGMTDLIQPEAVGPNTKESRCEEIGFAWRAMLSQLLTELGSPT